MNFIILINIIFTTNVEPLSHFKTILVAILHNNNDQPKRPDQLLQQQQYHDIRWIHLQWIKINYRKDRIFQFPKNPISNWQSRRTARTHQWKLLDLCCWITHHGRKWSIQIQSSVQYLPQWSRRTLLSQWYLHYCALIWISFIYLS